MSFSSPSGQGGWQNSPQGQRWDQRFQQFEDRNPRIAQMLGGMGWGGAHGGPTGNPINQGGMGGDSGPPERPMTPLPGGVSGFGGEVGGTPIQAGGLGGGGPPDGGQTGPGGPPPQQGFWANPSPALGVGTNVGSQMPASVPQPPWRRNYGGSGLSI